MTVARDSNYVWITWLSKLMASEVQCTWSAWFKTHYTDYVRRPSDFNLPQWRVEHNILVRQIVEERRALGERVLVEKQNNFHLPLSATIKLAGTPDLITISPDGTGRIFDAKTGTPKTSDQIQMMLYMLCLPSAVKAYRGMRFGGSLVYASGQRVEIPCEAITPEFKTSARTFVNLLDSPTEPDRVPSPDECRYCDIAECAERMEPLADDEIPELDW